MNEAIIDYHERRRPFVIIPEIGIIFSRSGNAFAHNELLQNCGFSEERVHEIIENFPRGTFWTIGWLFIRAKMLPKGKVGR